MNKILLIAFLFFLADAFAQAPDTLWTKIIGGSMVDVGNEILQIADGGFIVAGYTNSFGVGQRDAYLIKLDSLGNTEWTKTYGAFLLEHATSVKQTSDSGFIISAFIFGNNSDFWLIKTDNNGDTLWTKSIGYPDDDFGTNLQIAEDGNFLIAGYTSSIGGGNRDMWLLKLDTAGEKLWEKTYGAETSEEGFKILKLSDGNLLIPGYQQTIITQERNGWVVKIDSAGNYIWDKNIGIAGYDDFTAAAEGEDGSYYYTGSIQTMFNGRDLRITKTDTSGNLIFDKTLGGTGNDFGYDIKSTDDGNFVITGELTDTDLTGLRQMWILKIDSEGDTLWTKHLSSVNGSGGFSLDQTTDGGYVIAGISNSGNTGTDVWVIRLMPETITDIKTEPARIPEAFALKQNYPNPFNPTTKIIFQIPTSPLYERGDRGEFVTLKVYDVLGNVIATLVNEEKNPGNYEVEFSVGQDSSPDLASGIYFYKIEVTPISGQAGNFIETKKMILLK